MFQYPIVGHWAWGPDGWLAVMQPLAFLDFAGSTVVHTIGGAISLVGAIALGPRLGRVFKRDGGGPMAPHDIILGACGGLILWFGWYGFNPGSTLSALDLLEYLRIDDPIGAVPVHMIAGIWGTLSLGLFASGAYGLPTPTGADTTTAITGLFYGGGVGQLAAQAIGSAAVTLTTLAVSFVLMYAVKLTGTLRVSPAGEIEGLDAHEHGVLAYPEHILNGKDGTPRSVDEAQALGRGSLPAAAAAGD